MKLARDANLPIRLYDIPRFGASRCHWRLFRALAAHRCFGNFVASMTASIGHLKTQHGGVHGIQVSCGIKKKIDLW
jgi:hypothetical protein